jgi:hypothetical protein
MNTSNKIEAQNHKLSAQVERDGAVSRRRFLLTGTMAGLSAGFFIEPGVIFAGQQPRSTRNFIYAGNLPDEARLDPVYSLTRSRFTPLLGDQFSVIAQEDGRDGKFRLNLIEVNDLKQPSNAGLIASSDDERGKELSFSLLFFGPHDAPLSQQTCDFKHSALGQFKVLIVPVGSDIHGRYYEVVFNRSNL